MDACCRAVNHAFTRSSQKITFQFDGGEVLRPGWEVGERAVAAAGIGEGNYGRGMQVSVWGEEFRADGEAAGQATRLEGQELDADQSRQVADTAGVELINRGHEVYFASPLCLHQLADVRELIRQGIRLLLGQFQRLSRSERRLSQRMVIESHRQFCPIEVGFCEVHGGGIPKTA